MRCSGFDKKEKLHRKPAIVAAALLLVLALPVTVAPVMVNAQEAAQEQGSTTLQEQASGAEALAVADVVGSAEKKEVVYTALDNAGANKSTYVVNVLEGAQGSVPTGSTVQDFGMYDQVVNLTNTSKLTQLPGSVIFTMPEGEFSYQGSLSDAQIPWNISIKYFLDGQEVAPNEIAGKSGKLELKIETPQNTAVDSRYFENYLMQITCTLPMEKATNIQTDQGSIALSGSDVTVNFMVMPGKNGSVSLDAEVTNFEMPGISFAAIPFSMALDFPDTDNLVAQFDGLIEGTEQIHEGAQDLAEGANELEVAAKQAASGAADIAMGADQMTQGLQQYQQGLRDQAATAEDSVSEEEITAATNRYKAALGVYATAYAQAYESVLAKYEQENPGEEISEEMQQVALAEAAKRMECTAPEEEMTDSLQDLLALTSTQIASQGAAEALKGAADGLGSSKDPASLLGGSASLDAGAQELASGLDQLAGGTGSLSEGMDEFSDGTQTLAQETQGIPDSVQAEIDELMSTYDKSDFEPASFTSSKNTNVTLVQFVMTTDSIKVDEPEVAEEPEKEESFLDRFLALF